MELSRIESDVSNFEAQLFMLDDFVASAEEIKKRIPELTDEERGELISLFVVNVSIGEECRVNLVFPSDHVKDSAGQRLAILPC